MNRFTRNRGARRMGLALTLTFALFLPHASRSFAQDMTAAAVNKLGFDIYAKLAARRNPENIFLSPVSIADVLAMIANGAKGETRRALLDVLGAPGATNDALNARLSALRASLTETARRDPAAFKLTIANGLWGRRGSSLRPAFVEALERGFDATATEADFADPATLRSVNRWIDQRTGGMIPTMLDALDRDSFLVLVNAVAFNARWAKTFSARNTRPRPFQRGDRTTVQVPMMRQLAHWPYVRSKDLNCAAVALSYRGSPTRMIIVLPDGGKSIQTWLRDFNLDRWTKLRNGLRSKRGHVIIPRMRFTYRTELESTLVGLGLGGLFGEGDLTGISPRNATVSRVVHQTAIEVDEKGTKAAAATAGLLAPGAAMIQDAPFQFLCDRPFFCAIEDRRTGAILFMGVVNDPGVASRRGA